MGRIQQWVRRICAQNDTELKEQPKELHQDVREKPKKVNKVTPWEDLWEDSWEGMHNWSDSELFYRYKIVLGGTSRATTPHPICY
jgi:hypothetical protein